MRYLSVVNVTKLVRFRAFGRFEEVREWRIVVEVHRKPINLIAPHVHHLITIDGPDCTPDNATTLEPRPEGHLPHPIAPLHPPLGFSIGQFIPHCTARSIPKSVKCHSRSFHVTLCQPQAPLQFVQYRFPTNMWQEVTERLLEIRNARPDICHVETPHDVARDVPELFGYGEDQGSQCGHVGLYGSDRCDQQVFGDGNP